MPDSSDPVHPSRQEGRFPVLLHPDLYRLLRQAGRQELGGLWKALRRLRDGLWGGGTRVKRLRGVGRPVYEARTGAGGRLLFTMARAPLASEPGRTASHLQIWDWVEHDDAERTARRNRSPEAGLLEMETLEELEIDEPPPHPDATFAEVLAGAGEPEPLLGFLLPPDGLDVHPAEPEPGVRWYRLDPGALAGEEELQRLLDRGGDELELLLTREQHAVVHAPGPVLLAGSAGSGKTTVSVHRLAAALGQPGTSAVYLSYSPALVDHARRLYRDVAVARGMDPLDSPQPGFFTFDDLYRSLVPREFPGRAAPPLSEARFREWFRRAGRPLDPALVWEELRSILKGACLSTARPMLDEAAYYELGKKRAPLFVDERPEIYRIAQRYQEWLAEEGRCDRIDLCRRAFAELRHGRAGGGGGRAWDVVICDEVQDLTELEVSFVLALSRRPDLSGVLLTGDTRQTVQPSGFRWAEARRLAGRTGDLRRRKEAPAVVRLRRNLRSVRPLVELANGLLLLRRDVFGRTEDDDPEEGCLAGPVPVEVPGTEEEALAALAGFGPRCAVLTLDDAEAERLRERLGTSRVFHVREAKGLEFDDVVLWKLLTPDRDLVERFGRAGLDREPRFEHLLQHLYVAVTRARRHLAIHEGPEAHPFWNGERFRGRLERDTVEGLARRFSELRAAASPGDWEREGDYYLERQCFRQAAECFRRAGLPEREAAALACSDEEREDWAGALARWSGLRQPARQAPLLERLGRTDDAAACYREAGLEEEARLCEVRLLESRHLWREAAAAWEGLGRTDDAIRCWERAAAYRERHGEAARAVELYASAGCWLDVARLEECHPAGRRRLLPKLREMVEAGEDAGGLIEARRRVLLERLPQIPWFLLTQGERLVWQELLDLEKLEHRRDALRAEAGRSWRRAARHWSLAEEPGRADEARRGSRPRPGLHPEAARRPAVRPAAEHPRPETLSRVLEGAAPSAEVRSVVRHLLQGCPVCARELVEARQPSALPSNSYDEVLERLRRKIAHGSLDALGALASPRAAPSLYSQLLAHEAVVGLVQVHSTRRYASLALCELLLQKSREIGPDDPERARKAAELAVRIAEQLDLDLYGAPVVQDMRPMAWAYLAESRPVGAEVKLAESSMTRAEGLLEGGMQSPLAQAELLTLEASLAGYCGRFEEALRLLSRAAAIYRRAGDRHLLGRTLLKKGTLLGNAGQQAAALRLIRRSIDLIDPPREPRLIVCATHNLIWFLNEGGRAGEVAACLDGARRLYERAGDQPHLSRLRWLEGKVAAPPRKAESALLAARDSLARQGLSYEAALAAMDLAVLYVREHREADMQRQADLLFPLFKSDDMYRETTTALLALQKTSGQLEAARLIDGLSGWVEQAWTEKNPPALAFA